MSTLLIPSLHQNGIREIYVVVGYRKELFAPLEAECLGVKLIEDPYYDRRNDIASLYCAGNIWKTPSSWTAEDGRKLRRHLEIEFEEKRDRQICWDDLALSCFPEDYALGIRVMCSDDVVEIDTLEEPVAIDAGCSALVGSDGS